MWQFHLQALDTQTRKITVTENARALSSRDVYERWQKEDAFNLAMMETLAALPFDAFFWETPPLASGDDQHAAEFVATNAPALARVQPDPGAFSGQFARDPKADVLTFPNLGGDALLVVPGPVDAPSCYAHLAVFIRTAPERQRLLFWKAVGAALADRLEKVHPAPVWLSTAGMGVSWLHLRLDSRPKYYRHQPYTVYPRK